MEFFQRSTGNLVAAAKEAGVGHHVVLSIVGADRMPDIGYMRAKVAQEGIVTRAACRSASCVPTQFFEFIPALAEGGAKGDTIHLSPVLMQPIAAADVSAALADVATARADQRRSSEVAGPEPLRLDDLGGGCSRSAMTPRTVVTDLDAGYFGGMVTDTLADARQRSRRSPTCARADEVRGVAQRDSRAALSAEGAWLRSMSWTSTISSCPNSSRRANDLDDAAEVFLRTRPRLFGIAYRMLGTRGGCRRHRAGGVAALAERTTGRRCEEPAAFLATTTTRLAINVAQSARARRETYVGPWLPEPVDTSADPTLGAERGEALECRRARCCWRSSPRPSAPRTCCARRSTTRTRRSRRSSSRPRRTRASW